MARRFLETLREPAFEQGAIKFLDVTNATTHFKQWTVTYHEIQQGQLDVLFVPGIEQFEEVLGAPDNLERSLFKLRIIQPLELERLFGGRASKKHKSRSLSAYGGKLLADQGLSTCLSSCSSLYAPSPRLNLSPHQEAKMLPSYSGS